MLGRYLEKEPALDRREFIKKTSTILASAAIEGKRAKLGAEERVTAGRLVLPMNRNWRFKAEKIDGAQAPNFDDSKFERIVIPHTNVLVPWNGFDDREYEFISTYRRRFKLPRNAAGKRVFVDFDGAMTASTVWINGALLGEYKGGFTPFSFELTDHLHQGGENVLVVQLDSTERADIPPFGNEIDYLTFGGIYREVSLRIVPSTYIDNIFARPRDVMSINPSLDVSCFIAGDILPDGQLSLAVELRDGDQLIARETRTIEGHAHLPHLTTVGTDPRDPYNAAPVYNSIESIDDPARYTVSLSKLAQIRRWDLEQPHLYTVHVQLLVDGKIVDEDERRVGFREAVFTDRGFSLNGEIVKLRGLDRHQTFPFVGQAMPARVQRRDAKILRHDLHCNIVRTSHYPQSRHFLDCCDEIGLLVLEELPGWQHIGDEEWKKVAIDNVGRMIRRDWNRPAVILWGVRINESKDDRDFYTRTNALAHALDDSRQTGGIRTFQSSEFLEDVFTMNDFGFPLKKPNHPRYLNTEFVGHTFPTKSTDDDERQREHTLRHARIHNQLASDPQYAGGIGWCAFDYNTHDNFGAGDRICYHGVSDIFREAKPAAGFYKSQCDPAEEVVLEPAFHWARGDESVGFSYAVICSNCDHLKIFIRSEYRKGNEWTLLAELDPDRGEFQYLKYPPFVLDVGKIRAGWGDLRIDGYLNGKLAISKSLSGRGVDRKFAVVADDLSLEANGADATRVVFRVTDEYGAIRPYANGAVQLSLEGPATLIGDNPFSLVGGTGAVWIRAAEEAGVVRLTVKHPRLGSQTIELHTIAVPPETV
jgi:beta-galactosidase